MAARDVTDASVAERAAAAGRFLDRPPWYARFAAGRPLTRLRLLRMVLGDCASGAYAKVPWRTIAICAAAVGYVILPWGTVKSGLREYCAWKGLSPAHFGL